MFDEYQSTINKRKEPWGIYISLKKFVFILVGLIFFFIFVFLAGVYIGRKEAILYLSQQGTQTETLRGEDSSLSSNALESISKPSGDTSSTQGPSSEQIGTPNTTSPPSVQTGVSDTINSTSGQIGIPDSLPSSSGDNIESSKAEEKPTPPVSETKTENPSNSPQPLNQPVLTPMTPPIDQEIPQKTVSSESPLVPATNTEVKQKPKTFSIQLSALTGDDAEKRARTIIDKLQKKYGNQYQIKLLPAGKFYKIIVINIPDEKTAREALRILSQEPDFKKAFIIKPQK